MPGPATYTPQEFTARQVYDRSQHPGPIKELRGPQARTRFQVSGADDVLPERDNAQSKHGGDSA